ncbi:MAG: hypothetical protein IOD12_14795 [Silvanigrellales bacterium]|jgi:hypothetical protein|nr:hypothetical protein [Silvanigrellales bacterium]
MFSQHHSFFSLSTGPNGSGTGGDGEDAATKVARVLPFDPKVRERLQQRSGAQAQAPITSGKSGNALKKGKTSGPGAVKESQTIRFRVYRGLEIAGVVFVLFVFLRTCGVGL